MGPSCGVFRAARRQHTGRRHKLGRRAGVGVLVIKKDVRIELLEYLVF
jgi:hypothetical protein